MVILFYLEKEMAKGIKMNLREIRFKRGMTQYDINRHSGIHQSRISLIERGYVSPKLKEKHAIAKALRVNPDEIKWPAKKEIDPGSR